MVVAGANRDFAASEEIRGEIGEQTDHAAGHADVDVLMPAWRSRPSSAAVTPSAQ